MNFDHSFQVNGAPAPQQEAHQVTTKPQSQSIPSTSFTDQKPGMPMNSHAHIGQQPGHLPQEHQGSINDLAGHITNTMPTAVSQDLMQQSSPLDCQYPHLQGIQEQQLISAMAQMSEDRKILPYNCQGTVQNTMCPVELTQAQAQISSTVAGVPSGIVIPNLGAVAPPDLLHQINPQLVGNFASQSSETPNLLMHQKRSTQGASDAQVAALHLARISRGNPNTSTGPTFATAHQSVSPAVQILEGSTQETLALGGQGGLSVQQTAATRNSGIQAENYPRSSECEGAAGLCTPRQEIDISAGSDHFSPPPLPLSHSHSLAEASPARSTMLPISNVQAASIMKPYQDEGLFASHIVGSHATQGMAAVKEELHQAPDGVVIEAGGVSVDGKREFLEEQGTRRPAAFQDMLDGSESPAEARKKIRAERNRQSAAASRERKKYHVKELQRRISFLSQENAQLKDGQHDIIRRRTDREKDLTQENEELKEKVQISEKRINDLTSTIASVKVSGKRSEDTSLKRPSSWSPGEWGKKKLTS